MPRHVIGWAFLNQTNPGGQVCVVEVFNDISHETRYLVQFLPGAQFGRSIQQDVLHAAAWGYQIPSNIGHAWITQLGDDTGSYEVP